MACCDRQGQSCQKMTKPLVSLVWSSSHISVPKEQLEGSFSHRDARAHGLKRPSSWNFVSGTATDHCMWEFISLWWSILQSLVWIQLHTLHTSVYLSKISFLYRYISLLVFHCVDLSVPWSKETTSQKIWSVVGAKGKQLERYPGIKTGKDRGQKERKGGGGSKHILFGS